MKSKMVPTSKIVARLGLQPKGPIHKFFTNTCALHIDKYVPFDKGNLARTVVVNGKVTSNVTDDTITYDQQYAKVVYYGVRKGKNIVIHTTKHAKATKYWDKVMWSAEKEKILKEVQDYVNKHGGK